MEKKGKKSWMSSFYREVGILNQPHLAMRIPKEGSISEKNKQDLENYWVGGLLKMGSKYIAKRKLLTTFLNI